MGWQYLITACVAGGIAFGVFGIWVLWRGDTKSDSGKVYDSKELPRIGGVIMLLVSLGLLLAHPLLVLPMTFQVFFVVCGLILLVGYWDDTRGLSWQWQLFWQWVFGTFLYAGGVRILTLSHPFGSVWHVEFWPWVVGYMIFLVWCILVMNALNWFDGVDGIAGFVSASTFATLGVLAVLPVVNQPPLALVASIFFGVTLAFLFYNVVLRRIFAGTVGVWFWGMSIIFLSVVAGAKIATAVVVLALPLLDALGVLWERFRDNVPLTQKDRRHLHYKLLDAGWSIRRVQGTFLFLTVLLAGAALLLPAVGKVVVVTAVACFVFSARQGLAMHKQDPQKSRMIVIGGVIVGMGIIAIGLWLYPVFHPHSVDILGTRYSLEVVTTDKEKAIGLSHRDGLCERCGMLFVFHPASKPIFWMDGMRFNLDIAWIQKDIIVGKEENVPYDTKELLPAPTLVDGVLELPAGSLLDVPIGTQVKYFK